MKIEELRAYPRTKTKICHVGRFTGLVGNSPEDSLDLGYTLLACNVKLSGGKIYRGSGVDVAKVGQYLVPSTVLVGATIKKSAIFKKRAANGDDYRVVYITNTGKAYQAKLGTAEQLTLINAPVTTSTELINYNDGQKDVMLLLGEGEISVFDGQNVVTNNGPSISGACVYDGSIYGVERGRNRVRCSERNRPFNWNDITNGAKFITFSDEGGQLRRTIACGDSVYVFRDYAVYRITGYTDISQYSISKIFVSHSPIYPETAAAWKGTIYFLGEDGFYSINGSRVDSIWKDAFTLIQDRTRAAGVCYDGTYYVTAKIKTDGIGQVGEEEHCVVNNGIIGVAPETGTVTVIRGVDVGGFIPCFVNGENKLFLLNTADGYRSMQLSMMTKDGKIYGALPELRWQSPRISFRSLGDDKIVRKIHLIARNDMTLKICLDKEKTYNLNGSNKTQTIAVNERGESVTIGFSSTAPVFSMDGFEIEYETVERRKYGAN